MKKRHISREKENKLEEQFPAKSHYSPTLFTQKKVKENELPNDLREFSPVCKQWETFLCEIISQKFDQIHISTSFEQIKSSLTEYEKIHTGTFASLAHRQENLTPQEAYLFHCMQHIKNFNPTDTLIFKEEFLKSVFKDLEKIYQTIDNNMQIFLKHQKAFEGFLNSLKHDNSIENIQIISTSLERLEVFLGSLASTFDNKKQNLSDKLTAVKKYVSTDPIAMYIDTELSNRLELLNKTYDLVHKSHMTCKNKQEELSTLLEDQIIFDIETLSSSTGT